MKKMGKMGLGLTPVRLGSVLVALCTASVGGITPSASAAGVAPVKQIVVAHAGGIVFTEDVAGGKEDTVYVADAGGNRVEEYDSAGHFIFMFGKEVNKTTKGSTCSESEIEKGAECKTGVAGTGAGALSRPGAVAVDPASGDVYVLEKAEGGNTRVDKFTAEGKFVWMIGKEVNKTTKGNLCTETEVEIGVECKAGVFPGTGSNITEHGAFAKPQTLAVGPGGILYVGDEYRVQEFDENGAWTGEIREPLEQISLETGSKVSRLAAAPSGDLFLVYETNFENRTILEFDAAGKKIEEFVGPPSLFILGLAVDPAGRLAIVENEQGELLGLLDQVEGATLRRITEFEAQGDDRISFDHAAKAHLYAAHDDTEVVTYKPVPVGELNIGPVVCVPGAVHETDVTLECELNGTVDPWGVKLTQVWFLWGRTPKLGEATPLIPVENPLVPVEEEKEEPLVSVKAIATGMVPNETIYYELEGEDATVKAPETLTSIVAELAVPSVPPRVVGEPSASFVNIHSADLFSEINPENTQTEYWFEYAREAVCAHLQECAQAARTRVSSSSTYGKIGAVLEATGLEPGTRYRYRLNAVNKNAENALNQTGETELPEGTFTTAPATAPSATTGAAQSIGQTTATITGTVDPDGQEATYSFELGVYDGPNTRFATVGSGPAGSGGPVEESANLTGLQPGVLYAYRIDIHSGYADGGTGQGVVLTFTTQSPPPLIQAPAAVQLLPTPPIKPPQLPLKCKKSHKPSKKNPCIRTGKKTRKRSKHHQKKKKH